MIKSAGTGNPPEDLRRARSDDGSEMMDAALASWGDELDEDVSDLASAASNISDAEARIRRLQERIRTPQRVVATPKPDTYASGLTTALYAKTAVATATEAATKTDSPRQLPHGLVPPAFASPARLPVTAAESLRLTPPELRRVVADTHGWSPVSPALTPPPAWTPSSLVMTRGMPTTRDTQIPPPVWTPMTVAREQAHKTPYADSTRHDFPVAARATPLRWDEPDTHAPDAARAGSIGGALMQHAASVAARRRGATSTSDWGTHTHTARASPSVRTSPLAARTPNGSVATSRSTPHRRAGRTEFGSGRENLRELNPRNVKLLVETVDRLIQRKCNLDNRSESLRERVAAFATTQRTDMDDCHSFRVGNRGLAMAGA